MSHTPPLPAPGPPPHGNFVYPPPPPPKRRRPSAWWFAVGALVLVGSLGGGITGLVYTAVDTFSTVGTVTANGTTQRIVADIEDDAFVWATPGATESCSIIDGATGEGVLREPVLATFTKSSGGRSWQATNRFDPGSGRLDITCPTGSSDIQIGPAAEFGQVFGSFAGFIGLLVLGSLLGVILLIVITILYVTGRPRDEATGESPRG